VLNPPGCFIRASLEATLRELGSPFEVAASINNIDMQVSLVASGIGLGLIPSRFLAGASEAPPAERITRSASAFEGSIRVHASRPLGRLNPRRHFCTKSFAAISPSARS